MSKFNASYPPAKACPTPSNCLGVTDTAAAACLECTTGPLCAVCEDTHYRLNGACSKCPEQKAAATALLVVIGLVLIAAVWVVLRCNAKDVPETNQWYQVHDAAKDAETPTDLQASETADEHKVSVMAMVKIVLSYTQVMSLLVEVYPGVHWPTSFRSFTDAQQFASSNPVSIVMPSCVSASLTITSYGEFMLAVWTPVVVAPIIWIYFQIKSRSCNDVEQLRAVCISTGSFVYFLLYPTIAVACVRVLAKCDEICDGNECIAYLRADYSIQCGMATHSNYKVGAGIAFTLYSAGFPAVIAYILYRGRKGATATTSSAWMAGFGFYSKNYKPQYYYWETVDLYRKLCITSMVVFIADGTSLQIAFGTVFAFIGFALQLVFSPFVNRNENRLAVASQAITVLALIIGGLIRSHEAEVAAQMGSGPIDEVVTAAYLITSGVLLYCLALIVWVMHAYFKRSTIDLPTVLDRTEGHVLVKVGQSAARQQSPTSDFAFVESSLMNGTRAIVEETVFGRAAEGMNSGKYLNVMANDSAGPKDGPTGDKKRPAVVAASRTEATAATSGTKKKKKKKKKKTSSTKKAAPDTFPVQEVPAPAGAACVRGSDVGKKMTKKKNASPPKASTKAIASATAVSAAVAATAAAAVETDVSLNKSTKTQSTSGTSLAMSQRSNPIFNADANVNNDNYLEVQDTLVLAETQFNGFGDLDGGSVDL